MSGLIQRTELISFYECLYRVIGPLAQLGFFPNFPVGFGLCRFLATPQKISIQENSFSIGSK